MEYRIASFNLKNFGQDSWKKRDLHKLAEIITEEELDVVALQEVLSEGKGVNHLIEELVKYELYEWDYCFEAPKDTSDTETVKTVNRSEGYAYLWNKSTFKIVEFSRLGNVKQFDPRIINTLSNDVNADCSFLARAPYYIRLEPMFGGFFELRLINIHIYWGNTSITAINKRIMEYEMLTQSIYPAISSKMYGNFRIPYTIAMGDYNLNIFSPFVQDKKAVLNPELIHNEGGKAISIITTQNELSTLKKNEDGYSNNYDHFTYSPERIQNVNVSCGVIDAVNKYCSGDYAYYNEKISDHLPILLKIDI